MGSNISRDCFATSLCLGEVFLIGKFGQSGQAPTPVPLVSRVKVSREQILVLVRHPSRLDDAHARILAQLDHPLAVPEAVTVPEILTPVLADCELQPDHLRVAVLRHR